LLQENGINEDLHSADLISRTYGLTKFYEKGKGQKQKGGTKQKGGNAIVEMGKRSTSELDRLMARWGATKK
jgi:hypothetical protein